jgi:hypothetical protein
LKYSKIKEGKMKSKLILVSIALASALLAGCKKDICTDPLATNYNENFSEKRGNNYSCNYRSRLNVYVSSGLIGQWKNLGATRCKISIDGARVFNNSFDSLPEFTNQDCESALISYEIRTADSFRDMRIWVECFNDSNVFITEKTVTEGLFSGNCQNYIFEQ